MKKILILALLASPSVFAASPDATYNINVNVYLLDHGNKKLVSSISQIANNDGKKINSYISRDVGNKDMGLREGLTVNGKIIKSAENDIFDFSGVETRLETLKTSNDHKWEEGYIKILNFRNSMLLKDPKTTYTANFEGEDKKYLLEVNVNKIDYIADLNPEKKDK